ncbi:lipase, putative [Ixodes scapularis]|uniref:Lipase, putative n=1 Tax=Ixodes scapularis TaxID=6945 RepID=B7P113_IXOSC|nr:lipase, putative [Ixodes scapularis]|eukprot:XP_002399847.1 lipase, putative [Ixodes scapularis]
MAYGMAWLVKTLVDAGTLNVSKMHYIGHSLGVQAAGLQVSQLFFSYYICLDPAGMDFKHENLNTEDADFVDVIHNNYGFLQRKIHSPIGHVDFYPDGNGQGRQSGCNSFGAY